MGADTQMIMEILDNPPAPNESCLHFNFRPAGHEEMMFTDWHEGRDGENHNRMNFDCGDAV